MAFGDWLKNAFKTGINWVGNMGKKIGQGINTFGGKVGDIYGKVKKIPILGNIIGNSPIGTAIDTGLGISRTIGNALQGNPDIGELGNLAKGAISGLGENPQKVGKSATELLSNLLA